MMSGNVDHRTDPVLQSFRVGDSLFNLGGALEPVAISDQLLRAFLVVDRAGHSGLLNSNHRLAVIGAGAAGVTATLHATMEFHVPTVLFEATGQPLNTHPYNCQTRWITPALYDWPAAHWEESTFPYPNTPSMPLGWEANTASVVGAKWRQQWMKATIPLIQSGVLNVQMPVTIDHCRRQGRGYILSSNSTPIDPSVEGPFDVVIVACGRGEERTWLGRNRHPSGFCGYPFWQTDTIETFNYDASGSLYPRSMTIVLSGGGDGAMQDLLRLTFYDQNRPSEPFNPGRLLRALEDSVRSKAGGGVWDRLLRQIWAAEVRAIRDKGWVEHDGQNYSDQQDALILERLNNGYQEAINVLLTDAAADVAINDTLNGWCRTDIGVINHVSRNPYCFSWGYPINRFLCNLLLALGARQTSGLGSGLPPAWRAPRPGSGVTFWLEASTAHVRPLGHARCDETCRGWRHEVELKLKDSTTKVIQADLLLIRHGLTRPQSIAGVPDVPLRRQVLPYTLLG